MGGQSDLLKGPPQDVFRNKYFVCACLVMAAVVGLSLARPAAQKVSNSTNHDCSFLHSWTFYAVLRVRSQCLDSFGIYNILTL